MEKKLPGVFANKIDRKVDNNRNVYYSSKQQEVTEEIVEKNKILPKLEGKSVTQKLYAIFHGPNYVYKADVIIVQKGQKITKKLIGYNHQNVISIDNEVIPISEIEDIYFAE